MNVVNTPHTKSPSIGPLNPKGKQKSKMLNSKNVKFSKIPKHILYQRRF